MVFFTWLADRIKNEPLAFGAMLRLGVLMGVAFGLSWTPEQIATTMAFLEAAIAFATRTVVTPNSKVDTITTKMGTGTGTSTVTVETTANAGTTTETRNP